MKHLRKASSILVISILILTSTHARIFREEGRPPEHVTGDHHIPILSTDPLTIVMSGYIINNLWWDTRQVFGFNDDYVLVFPEKKLLDPNCQDINAHGQVDIMPIESTIRFDILGPEIGGATSSGAIEATFFGQNQPSIGTFTLLQCYMQLDWPHVSFLAGQSYHPIGYPARFPQTVSYNYGTPIAQYAQVPQLRTTVHTDYGDLYAALMSEVNFPGVGPASFEGPSGPSTFYFRASMMPKMHLQLRAPISDHYLGMGVDFKRIVPRLVTQKCFKADESLLSGAMIMYFEFHRDSLGGTIKASVAQNATEYSLLGGYAVSSVDPVTDHRTYTNLTAATCFLDIQKRICNIEPGLFCGVLKNLGSSKNVIQSITNADGIVEPTIYGLGTDIDTLFRFSPRLRYYNGPLVVATEFEWTRAAFGQLNRTGQVINTCPVSNIRFVFAMYYYF